MPRTARIDHPNLLYHVMVRGIEGRDIFVDDTDRQRFLDRLSALLVETSTKCFAWALMRNHFHLLLTPQAHPLSLLMRRLLTGYAVNFNRRHNRTGHLFQNRYKAIICDEDPYLLELIRYIHLNPLRVGAVKDMDELDGYPWSGHAVLMGTAALAGQDADEALALFAKTRKKARRLYRGFVEDGVLQGRRDEFVGGGMKRSRTDADTQDTEGDGLFDQRILGGGAFVEQVLNRASAGGPPVARPSLADLGEKVSVCLDIDPDDLVRPGKARKPATARALFCYLALRKMGYMGAEVGAFLHLGSSGVSLAATRGEKYARANPGIRFLPDTIEK